MKFSINIKKINQYLEDYKFNFYKQKEVDLMNAKKIDNYNKILDCHSGIIDTFSVFIIVFSFVISLFFSIFVFNSLLKLIPDLCMALSCISSVSLTTFSVYLFKKIYHKFLLASIKNNKDELTKNLEFEHEDELNRSIIPENIHNLLKIELSDNEYLHLRKKGLTYANVKEIINPKISEILDYEFNQILLNEKHTVALNKDEINYFSKNYA